MNAVAALMAWFVLKPMRRKHIAAANLTEPAPAPVPAPAV